MRHVGRIAFAAIFAAGAAWSSAAAGMGAAPSPGVAVTVPPLSTYQGNQFNAYQGDQFGGPQLGTYCATSARVCALHRAGYVGGPCSCHVPGGRVPGNIVAQ